MLMFGHLSLMFERYPLLGRGAAGREELPSKACSGLGSTRMDAFSGRRNAMVRRTLGLGEGLGNEKQRDRERERER